MDLFSRVLALSAGYPPTAGVDTTNKQTEFFLDEGMMESAGNFMVARELRQAGHPVKHIITLRDHGGSTENEDFTERWLMASWATPNPAARPAPTVLAGPVPLLTSAMVSQLAAFWTRFLQEPESIRVAARQPHVREVAVAIGDQQPSFVLTDMPALAAQFPSVAAALKQADLILLDANPLDDIANARAIRAVVANGRYLDRSTLDSLLVPPDTAELSGHTSP